MKKLLMLSAFIPALFLSACGEGWEMRAYHNTPYGERTAGTGVEYVRAHMMPEKGPVIKAQETDFKETPAPVAEIVPEATEDNVNLLINSGEKFFTDLQKK